MGIMCEQRRILALILFATVTSGAPSTPARQAGQTPLGRTIGFWHVTDFHTDLAYIEGGDAQDFCHERTSPTAPPFPTAGPPTQPPSPGVGAFGDTRCDTPYNVSAEAVNAMARLHPDARFIIWTGDSAPHLPNNRTNTYAVGDTLSTLTYLIEAAFPYTPLFAVLGNHDYWPSDQFPTTTNYIYQKAAALWSRWLGPIASESLTWTGYYKLDISYLIPRTLLLSLNTNLLYAPDAQSASMEDPAAQYDFMQRTFDEARASAFKVLIIGHVQPGSSEPRPYSMTPAHNRRFITVLAQNADVIQGAHFGHTHKDLLTFIKNATTTGTGEGTTENVVAWLLTAPSVNVWRGDGRNPAVRYVEVDAESGDLQRITQYYMNFTEANRLHRRLDWTIEYTLTIPTETTSLDFLAQTYFTAIALNTSGAFDEYVRRVNVQAPNVLDTCRADATRCYASYVCGITELDYDAYDRCINGSIWMPTTQSSTPSTTTSKATWAAAPATPTLILILTATTLLLSHCTTFASTL